MKVIIDLQEEDYNTIINSLYYIPKQAMEMRVVEAIKVGTVLPEGHGDLIDRDKLHLVAMVHDSEAKRIIGEINKAPTVIEADKEAER